MSAPTRPSPASFLKHAADIASFYGFRPLREIERRTPGLQPRAHSFAAATHACIEHLSHKPGEPVLAYWASTSPMHIPPGADLSPRETGEFGLHIVGVPESVAEVVLLKAVVTIINEWGTPVERVRLNALGDKDSKVRFEREVSAYLRKHAHALHEECREALAKQPLSPYACTTTECRSVVESGPRPMNFLSEKSRIHFREVLEHLERLALPYEFDDLLMLDEREARMLFTFDLAGEDATIQTGWGGRFDDHLRRLSPKKDLSAVSASIFFRKKGLAAESFRLEGGGSSPSVYFIQLGLRAKLEGLQVVDVLREAGIPLLQSFDSAKLSPQLQAAREAGVSHLIIMGAREALDRTVLVRAMDDSRQAVVGLSELPRYLKALR